MAKRDVNVVGLRTLTKVLGLDAAGKVSRADLTDFSGTPGMLLRVATDGTDEAIAAASGADAVNVAVTDIPLAPSSLIGLMSWGTAITCAATLVIPNDGVVFQVNGSTGPVTDIDFSAGTGRPVFLYFASTPTFTHNATTLILPTGVSLTMAAGDIMLVLPMGGDNVVCFVWRADGTPLISSLTNHIFIPAFALTPTVTSGAEANVLETTTNKVNINYLGFDTSADEYAVIQNMLPGRWNGGTITARFIWMHPSTTVNFGIAFGMQGLSLGDAEATDTAWGTGVVATDTGGTTNMLYITAATAAITVAGAGVGEMQFFRVYRSTANAGDTLAVDARLIGIQISYTANKIKDV